MAGEECPPLTAQPVDTGRWCYEPQLVTVSCFPVDTGCSEDGECFRRPSDGAAFVGSSTCLRGLGWAECLGADENGSPPAV